MVMARFCLHTLVFGFAVSTSIFAEAQSEDLTVDALHAPIGLSGPSLRGAQFSPDAKMISFLRGSADDGSRLDLWAYDVATGEEKLLVASSSLVTGDTELSEEEKNRRERQRIYDTGIVSYRWAKDGKSILFPLGGDVFTFDLASQSVERVTNTAGFETDVRTSPDANYVSYVRDSELFVFDRNNQKERQVTRGAEGTIRNATAEFVAQEELSRSTGYWWSPSEEKIVFTQIDEAPVVLVERLEFSTDGLRTIKQRYPFAGTDNVSIRLGITTPAGGRPKWVELGDSQEIYIADVHWADDGRHFYVERLSRDQHRLDLVKVNAETASSEIVLTDTDDEWVNLTHGFRALSDGGFLWTSERDGFNHIYRYNDESAELTQLTSGKWPVSRILCVSEDSDTIAFSGWQETATERHLYTVSLDGGEIRQITKAAGWHSGQFGSGCEDFIHSYAAPDQPRQSRVVSVSDGTRFTLFENALDDSHPYAPYLDSHLDWEYGQLSAEDGQMLDYALLVPEGLARDGSAKAAAIQLVYGGPGVQRVRKTWGHLYAQLLADQGYVVFMLDNRGAANRGKAFEDVIDLKMGQPEVRDQALGTEWLIETGFVDPDRIGVQGWSYGGYMTLMMLAQKPELYAAGISGAPVTDWRTYDTAYTERFMGDPNEEKEAYDASSVLTYADNIKDDTLLLIHGMADDNVIFQNAIDVMAHLQNAGTRFDLMTYPGEKHGFRSRENRMHRDVLGLEFFNERLDPARRTK